MNPMVNELLGRGAPYSTLELINMVVELVSSDGSYTMDEILIICYAHSIKDKTYDPTMLHNPEDIRLTIDAVPDLTYALNYFNKLKIIQLNVI